MTPLRVAQGRLCNADGWLHWRGISEFSAVHLVRTGQEAELVRRLDRASAAGRNGIRVLMMARNLFNLSPSQPGYWEAADRAVELAAERGLYFEAVAFADAQGVMPDMTQRRVYAAAFGAWCQQHPNVIPQAANEPVFNGFTGATDTDLIALSEIIKSACDHPLSIGDPMDVIDDPATGNPLASDLATLAASSDILVLHGDRAVDAGRWARWVDHLKEFADLPNPLNRYRIHDEPMGAASVFENGKRDNRPDAHLAAALCCAVMGIGFTLHYISEQSDDIGPIIEACQAQALVPASPDFKFRNAGTGGAAVTTFDGFDKIRTCDNGTEAWAMGYGNQKGLVGWASGWKPATVIETDHVVLWKAVR